MNIIAVCSMFVLIKCTYNIYRLLRFSWGLNRNIGRLEVTEAQRPIPRRTCALHCASSTGNGKWMHMVKIPLEQSPFPVKATNCQGSKIISIWNYPFFYNGGVNNEITSSCFKKKTSHVHGASQTMTSENQHRTFSARILSAHLTIKKHQLTITSSPSYM